ncbi:urea amidolyase associated protein UAAP2 [Halalkalibacter akibai]|uniref:Urea carboxylase-related aminomethyltransferase n=1 Tax=Halalkalibacter akibai (strain ATCC 43226 / DSM 21942 / CIP 109018 / JCM 9157 / 1139) TaxID=1236973 RepID=W4QYI6_HALA3|nr:urea amidolyase associated protein UAAP2 [Halalkalibacter akibai]GAE36733.1 urea carboxylase-related aminomethyltransferase [Halalkalibacter akibai JCM 9157]
MAVFNRVESKRKIEDAIYDEVVLAGDGWMRELEPGQVLRIVDVEGNQAADTLFFDADHPEDHYSAVATIAGQSNIYLSTGSVLRSESGKPLLTIVADTCGRHDTLGGSCSAQSNTVRYSHDTLPMHNCRDTFMLEMAKFDGEYTKRDLAPNINFFMNVPVTPEGGLTFADGVSGPERYVEMRSECRTVVLISNCPQLNNPCNAYNPTPVRVLIWQE